MPYIFLKETAAERWHPHAVLLFYFIITLSVSENCVPNTMKIARVKSLYKKTSNLNVGKYRPVSILSVVFKIIEKAISFSLKLIWSKTILFTITSVASEAFSLQILVFFIFWITITKTCLYNFDPLKLHFYIVKLGFTGVYIIFLISAQNIDCGYSLEPPRRGGSNEYPQSVFEQKYEKYEFFYLKIFQFFGSEIFYIVE